MTSSHTDKYREGLSIYAGEIFPCDAMHKCGLCHHAVSVCMSGCLSVTFVYSVETSEHILRLFW